MEGKGAAAAAPFFRFGNCADGALVDKYNFFIFEVVKAHAAPSPKNPKTLHYRGHGEFMVAGGSRNLRKLFRPENL